MRVSEGVAYWLNPRSNQELPSGSVMLCSEYAQGLIRASQVGGAVMHYFRLNPERLTGLVSLSEQQLLQNAAALDQSAVRLFEPGDAISEKFRAACLRHTEGGSGFLLRLQLLDLFFGGFGHHELAAPKPAPEVAADAKARLTVMLNQTPASELLDLSFQELVEEMRCTPRHLSRVFHQVVGMSFREKQAQVRLIRAQELLATTESKVLEVALESGYQSLSLFNLMFKKRFGVTPGEWRTQQRSRSDSALRKSRRPQLRLAVARM